MTQDDPRLDALEDHVVFKEVTGDHVHGWAIIPYTDGVFVVIEKLKNHRPRYHGWYCVTKTALSGSSLKVYDHLGEFDGFHIYQSKEDQLPEWSDAGDTKSDSPE